MKKHKHQCPYCDKIYDCEDTCYSARITNKICPSCKAIFDRQMEAIKGKGREWHHNRNF